MSETKTYTVRLFLTGYLDVEVNAENPEAAIEAAAEQFEDGEADVFEAVLWEDERDFRKPEVREGSPE
jgi:hypothetical protein